MAQKTVLVPDIGEVLLAKRRGTKNIRLSVSATGQVRVSIPSWAPYGAGVAFAKSRLEWIQKNLEAHQTTLIRPGSQIGKAHRMVFVPTNSKSVSTRVTSTTVQISTGLAYNHPAVQVKAGAAAERALAAEAKTLLPQRLKFLASKYGYEYSDVKIKKLTGRWGSCSSKKIITLSYYLVQLPWEHIDYVLLHELVHTRHMNHSGQFWSEFKNILPSARVLQKEMHKHKPRLEPR